MEKSDIELAREIGALLGVEAGEEIRFRLSVGALVDQQLVPAARDSARAVERSIRVGEIAPTEEAEAYAAAFRSNIIDRCTEGEC